jgi:NAD(P)-dependent dehydrogenase (short-subunit alcohol dehydrogenase family)
MTNTVLVTGANRGIGLEFCRHYQHRGDQVIGVCRQRSNELQEMGVEIIDGIDIGDLSSLHNLRQKLRGMTLDILVNNAGILHVEYLKQMDWDHIQKQLDINAIGPLRVTHTLLDNLVAGSKVALVTSRMGSIQDNNSGGYYGYRMSKAALNAAGKSLAIDLRPRGIAVALLHPGYVRTDMTQHNGDIMPDIAASRLMQRIDELTLDTTGGFWHSNGERLEW